MAIFFIRGASFPHLRRGVQCLRNLRSHFARILQNACTFFYGLYRVLDGGYYCLWSKAYARLAGSSI
jgi:hypothetical protein